MGILKAGCAFWAIIACLAFRVKLLALLAFLVIGNIIRV
jgi:hypothetical protein